MDKLNFLFSDQNTDNSSNTQTEVTYATLTQPTREEPETDITSKFETEFPNIQGIISLIIFCHIL